MRTSAAPKSLTVRLNACQPLHPLHPKLPALEVAQEHGGEREEEPAGDAWQQQCGVADDGAGGDGERQRGVHEQ